MIDAPHPAVVLQAERSGSPLVLVRRLSDGRVKHRPRATVERMMLPSGFWALEAETIDDEPPVKIRFRKGGRKTAEIHGLTDAELRRLADADGYVMKTAILAALPMIEFARSHMANLPRPIGGTR